MLIYSVLSSPLVDYFVLQTEIFECTSHILVTFIEVITEYSLNNS